MKIYDGLLKWLFQMLTKTWKILDETVLLKIEICFLKFWNLQSTFSQLGYSMSALKKIRNILGKYVYWTLFWAWWRVKACTNKELHNRDLMRTLRSFLGYIFHRTPPGDCFWKLISRNFVYQIPLHTLNTSVYL